MESKFSCPKCGYAQIRYFTVCPSCQVVLSKLSNPSVRSMKTKRMPGKSEKTRKYQIIFIAIAFPVALALFLGQVHIIRGSSYHGPLLAKKSIFGYSETFINTDQILGMPVIGAKSQYPLSVKTLQHLGFLESDEDHEERVRSEIQEKIDRELKENQKRMDELMNKYKFSN